MRYLIFLILLSWFGFGNPIYHLPLLVFILPCVFIYIGLKYEPRDAFSKSWIVGILAYSIYLYWVVIPVHYYGYLPWILSIWCPILLGIYLGLYVAIFSFFISTFKKDLPWLFLGIFAGSLWSCLEFIRAKLLTGFPWLCLAQGLAKWASFVQIVGIVGAFGLGGILVCSITWIFLFKKSHRAPLMGVFFIMVVFFYGKWNLYINTLPKAKQNIAVVQGNIPQAMKWDFKYAQFTMDTYLNLTENAILKFHPRIVIWPETALPFYLQDDSPFSRQIRGFVKRNKIFLMTGAPAYKKKGNKYYFYNRLYLLGPDGKILDFYDKEHLVPFGEYVPLKNILFFLDKLVVGAGDFVPGKQCHPLSVGRFRFGPLICYEVIFPSLVQKRVVQGANVLINVSNDAWFGNSSGPYQHLNQAILRAVEQNRYIIRATNSGISAIINPKGIVERKLKLFERGIIDFEIHPIKKRTFFSRYYTVICSSFFLINMLFFFYKAKKLLS